MKLEQGLRAALVADSDVNALVSGRVYLERMPQAGAYPCVVYNRIGTSTNSLVSEVETLAEVRVQFDCWADSAVDAYDLAGKVRAATVGQQGSFGGVEVQWSKFENEINASDFDGDEKQFRLIVTVTFWLHE